MINGVSYSVDPETVEVYVVNNAIGLGRLGNLFFVTRQADEVEPFGRRLRVVRGRRGCDSQGAEADLVAVGYEAEFAMPKREWCDNRGTSPPRH